MTTNGKIALACVAIMLLCTTGADAQNIARFRGQLARPGNNMASATVYEHGTARDAVSEFDARVKPQTITGYRIRIFFDNSQNARSEALAAQARFNTLFSGIPTYFVYDTPSFMVTVGNAVTMEEALVLWNHVKGHFPTAFLWRGEIPLRELLRFDTPPAAIPQDEMPADKIEFKEALPIN